MDFDVNQPNMGQNTPASSICYNEYINLKITGLNKDG